MPPLRPLLLLPLFAIGRTFAQAPVSTPTPAPAAVGEGLPAPDFAGSLVQMLFGLALVIALLFGCLWIIRRLSARRGGAAAIQVLGAAAVGPRERVVLVQLGEQVLVLGVAPGSVSKLHEMKRDDLPLASLGSSSASGAGNPPSPNFSSWLKHALEHRNAR